MDLNKKSEIILKKLKENKFYEVISECEKLIKRFPDKSNLYNMCGLAYQRIKNIDISINYFKKIKLYKQQTGRDYDTRTELEIYNDLKKEDEAKALGRCE